MRVKDLDAVAGMCICNLFACAIIDVNCYWNMVLLVCAVIGMYCPWCGCAVIGVRCYWCVLLLICAVIDICRY